jgi:tRNA threonylcarbamoyl adenosine modification protein YeaZ
MLYYLAIQNTYTHLQMALFKDSIQLAFAQIDKTKASKECILVLNSILQENQIALADLAFIGVNQGPGPFTTLRVVISTVNGLSFATGIPLIGVNALQALLEQHTIGKNAVAILNAFGNDLYYGIKKDSDSPIYGCTNIQTLIAEINQKIPPTEPILFLGNGIHQCKEILHATFGDRAHMLPLNPETASLNQIAAMALDSWQQQTNISYQIQPLYFKAAFHQL